MSTGKYLKPAKRVSCPAVVFGIAVETETIPATNTKQYQERIFSHVAASVSRKRNGRWSKPTTIETDNADSLHQWMIERADKKRRNYVIADIASEVLTLTQWWSYAKKQGIRFSGDNGDDKAQSGCNEKPTDIAVRRCILRGLPDIFDYTDKGKRFVWLSGRQYIDNEEKAIAEAIGFREEQSLLSGLGGQGRKYTTIDRAIMWQQLLQQLSNWWSENATAPFGLTLGSMAMGILRSYTKPKSLSTHTDEYSHRLERLACYGGRASVWFVGSIGNAPISPVYLQSNVGKRIAPLPVDTIRLVDVRSMYPYLLRECSYPAKYAGRIGAVSGNEIRELCSHYGVIANVIIYSDTGEYPYRTKSRVAYPRGYFQTVLTGPEIVSIAGKDEIVKVLDGTLYYLNTPFKAAAQALLDMRLKARAEKRLVWEIFSKNVANNLGGKLAQRRSIWKPRPDIPSKMEWGEWIASMPDSDSAIRFRAIQDMVFEYVKDDGGYGPYTASFAYLTAYGRLHMRAIRKLCPQDSVLSQDTDGIWLLGDSAYNLLQNKCSFANDPGCLQIKNLTTSCVFLSPRHYWTDAGWTLAGFHNATVNHNTMTVQDSYTLNPAIAGSRSIPTTLITRARESALLLDHIGGTVKPDGWIDPLWIEPPASYYA